MTDPFARFDNLPAFVPRDSPLCNLPVNVDGEQRVLFDAVRYSIEIVDLTYRRMVHSIDEWLSTGDHPRDGVFASLLSDAWAMTDALHRLNSVVIVLVKSQPQVPEYVMRLHAALSGVVQLRNAGQHVAGRTQRLASRKETPWGTVSWLAIRGDAPAEAWVYTIVPGTVQPATHRTLTVGGKDLYSRIDLITLSSDNQRVCLSETFRAVATFAASLQIDLTSTFCGELSVGSDLVIKARLDWEVPTPELKTRSTQPP